MNYTKEKNKLFHILKNEGITDRTLNAMYDVPREEFIPEKYRYMAYDNNALPIGNGQTISQPYVVGYMIDQLELNRSDKVLEIGTGSGYNLAILTKLCSYVVSIEVINDLAINANNILKKIKCTNYKIVVRDGHKGYKRDAPYDKIIITCGTDTIPKKIFKQLKIGGIMILPLKDRYNEYLTKITKISNTKYKKERLIPVAFVPFVNK